LARSLRGLQASLVAQLNLRRQQLLDRFGRVIFLRDG
jgi:hypothetical protein